MARPKNKRNLGRNAPCWCGSGKKFKKCHLNRETQSPDNPHEVMKQLQSYNRRKLCLHPDSGPANCSDKIVHAHTIQRGGSLKRIAEKGHVLGFAFDASTLNKTSGRIDVKSIGINKASTFNGFCSYHDNNTFAPLEDRAFEATDQQCFLLGYRAICRELYQKATVLEAMDFLRSQDQGRPVHDQAFWQDFLNRHELGASAGHRDLVSRKTSFDAVLQTESFADCSHYVIETREIPSVLATFGVTVEFDFHGNRLQDLSDLQKQLNAIYVSIIACDDRGAIVFSWLEDEDGACRRFVRSLNDLDDNEIPDALTRLVFEYSENTFFRPSWWKELSQEKRDVLLNRITTAADPSKLRQPVCLMPDGHSFAPWSVESRRTNQQLS